MIRNLIAVAAVCSVATTARAQAAAKPAYPVPPQSLGEVEEIALARSAAPDEISAAADVYVLRGTDFVKVRSGTNGCACMVGRDSHEGSRYPICFDQEGVTTSLRREIKEASMRAQGKSEAEVEAAVHAAYASGELRMPARGSMSYMMSPRQVLFSSAKADGVRVGAWWPHVMFMMPGMAPDQLGITAASKYDIVSIRQEGEHHAEVVVKVPRWSDGKAAP